ncbi:MAG: bis(5'-nucleosyl)-tetraphosphatase (symmetrical) YqeK [Clostridia bacterium]|nr:bis(5'-nucleosyl)-tetraphosphatase (symmetrical) YqeK [Clostridia bacterium]
MIERKEEFLAILREKLQDARFQHSRNVADSAVILAEQNGADTEKAYICGLLHDIEKNAPPEEQKRYMLQLGDDLPKHVLENPKLWHAPAGAAFVRDELGITDPEMVRAIKYHTTGRPGMTMLEKVIYVADFISAERDYPGVERVRETAYRNIDEAILVGSQFTLMTLLERWREINYDTIAMYNEMAAEVGDQMEGHS